MSSRTLAGLLSSRLLRRILLPMFERFNPGDVRIRHHYTGRRLLLHSYRHKGYWFHGRRREQSTMRFFQQVLRKGDTVLEVGGHIGYLTMYLAHLVGDDGRVIVFEPGRNNLPYLRANVNGLRAVQIIESAVSDADGSAAFFEEELSGQNNSLFGDYERFEQNLQLAFSHCSYHEQEVATVRLDTVVRQQQIRPDLVKIDIEGAEYLALTGAGDTLADYLPILMVEVTRRAADVFDLLTGLGYLLFTPDGRPLCDAAALNGNVCAVHPTRRDDRLRHWRRQPQRAA